VLAVRRKPRLGNGIWIFLAALACMALTGAESYVHYFEPLIIPFSLGIGVACAALSRGIFGNEMRIWVRPFLVPILLLPWFYPALQHASYFIVRTEDGFRRMTPEEFETGIRTFAPFNASPEVARYIAERTEPDECFMIVGSEPQIFFYADRSSCTRIAFLYPATGPYTYASQLSAEFFRDLVTKRPRYVLLLRLRSSVGHGDPEQNTFLETALAILERDYYVESELPEEPVAPGEPAGYVWVYRRYE
jgi:hypothetical protein